MSFNVTTTQIVTFRNNMELALQQKKAKFAELAITVPGSGKSVEITNLIGTAQTAENNTRHGDTIYQNSPHDRRWVHFQNELYYAELVDEADKLRAGIDLQGAYVMQGAAALQRAKDRRFLEGFYGTAFTGETGTTQVTFPAGNIGAVDIGAASATGLNVAKLRWARRRFQTNLVDLEEEELYVGITSVQEDNLLNEVQATSFDFISARDMSVIESGKLPKLLGFNFVNLEYGNTTSFPAAVAALSLDASSYRRVPVWCKSGMACANWQDMRSSIDPLPGKQLSVQVFAGTTRAYSRTQEGKCLQLLCAES